MSTSSYLPDQAGGMVVASAFADEASASAAIDHLRSSGIRMQDVSVVAQSAAFARRLAADRAWTPARNDGILRRLLPGGGLPADLRAHFRDELRRGQVVIVVAADGQPPDTIAALFAQAHGERVTQWWQRPADLFAPPEEAGPF